MRNPTKILLKSWNFSTHPKKFIFQLPPDFLFPLESWKFFIFFIPLKLSISQTKKKLFSSFVSHKNGFFNQIFFFLHFYHLDENLHFENWRVLDEICWTCLKKKKKLKKVCKTDRKNTPEPSCNAWIQNKWILLLLFLVWFMWSEFLGILKELLNVESFCEIFENGLCEFGRNNLKILNLISKFWNLTSKFST